MVDLDVDHELLLKSCVPLLQSRNSGVVLAVAKLFYYLSPATEAEKIAKPLVRLLRSHREQSYVVLSNIATMALKRPVSSFFIMYVLIYAHANSSFSSFSIYLNHLYNSFMLNHQSLYLYVTQNWIF